MNEASINRNEAAPYGVALRRGFSRCGDIGSDQWRCAGSTQVAGSYRTGVLPAVRVMFGVFAVTAAGCNSIMNGWLDPTVLGNFQQSAMLEIRSSLTLEDLPSGIPGATYPVAEDLVVEPVEYPITAGDTLAVEIYELRQRQTPYAAQLVVSSTGTVNLPVIGQVAAAGLTIPEFEESLRQTLIDGGLLLDPDVNANPLFLQNATYSIFGIGVSAANNAPLRAGTFPIRRPDLRLLEAINQVGGLNEFVSEVFIFRFDVPPWELSPWTPQKRQIQTPDIAPTEGSPREETGGPPEGAGILKSEEQTAAQELIDVIEGGSPPGQDQTPEAGAAEELARSLEPDATDPFIWVNGEFVVNPLYRGPAQGAAAPPGLVMTDTIAPAVSWARIAGETAYRIIRVPAEVLRSGDPQVNIVVRGGDVIRISSGEIGIYYVMGQVSRVGAFAFNAEPVTLKSAIAAAGGLSPLAWPDRCTVYRRVGQREQMIQVNLDRMFAGLDPDFYIKRGDIVNVGTHPFAPFLQRIRAWTLPNPINNVGYSFTYSRNYADIDSFAVRQNPHNEPDRFPGLFP
jgi:protein involved in polysaccharide export with SLBB domain